MACRRRVAVGTALLVFTLTAAASVQLSTAAPRARTRTPASSAGSAVPVQLGVRIEALRRQLTLIDQGLAELSAATAALSTSVHAVSPEVQQAKHEVARRSKAAQEAALPASLAAAASTAMAPTLVEPLQTVSWAMQSKDAYVAALLQMLSTMHRQSIPLDGLSDTGRLLESEVELRSNELAGLLADATRIAHEPPPAGDATLVPLEGIRAEIGRALALRAGVERADADLVAISLYLKSREDGVLEQLKGADATGDMLQQAMVTVERFVGDTFPELALTPQTPVIGGVLEICPVDQPHSYTDDFGAPRWAGGYHPHEGNDIFAPLGTAIRAPFDGMAVGTPNTLGGRAVTIYGQAGYAYNAHLSEYGTLGDVRTGTIIGYVGNTGDAINSAPHDHFEWHPGNGPAVDPFPFLNAVCVLPAHSTAQAAPTGVNR